MRPMSLSSLPIDSVAVFVADASVIINLNATGRASEIVGAFPDKFVATGITVAELEAGAKKGHDDAEKLRYLIENGLFELVQLGEVGGAIYASLIDGTAIQTLDDGEASTIGYACERGCVALIDERKARSICAIRFPQLRVLSTVDLLIHNRAALALGRQGQADAIFNALRSARMRVPNEHLSKVIGLIGKERAATCSSLPRGRAI